MQALDGLIDGQVVIAATNRCDRMDKALLRRFQRKIEFVPFVQEERIAMIQTFVNSVDPTFLTDKILQYAEEPHTQAETIRYLIEKIVEIVN